MSPLILATVLVLTAAGAGLVGYLLGASRRAALLEERLLNETGLRTAAEATARQLDGLRSELGTRESELAGLRAEARMLGEARQQLATELEARERALAEQRGLLDTAQLKLSDVFRSLAAETLRANNQQFIDLAKSQFETLREAARGDLERRQLGFQQLVEPVRESLEKVQARIGEIEKDRVGAYGQLLQQVESLALGQAELRRETGNLVGALRRPSVRGRWGEVQLKRVVELAGMLDQVDFVEQEHLAAEGGDLRPDLIVKLPGGKSLVVDAKAPLEAYLESLELTDGPARTQKLVDHARQIRDHIAKLSLKQYWDQFENTPDFVVLFIPGEVFYSAALEQDPGLIEAGISRKVILATPTTLIALLRTVAYGWRQEALAENARGIAALGADLYERIQVMAGHWSSMGQGLRRALTAYNDAVGSLESRVLPAARRFRDLNVGTEAKDIEAPAPVDALPREVQAEEMRTPAAVPHVPGTESDAERH
jgi:DNA recombination protein RmuC